MGAVMELNEHLRRHVPESGAFDWLMRRSGVVHREVKNRRTVEFELQGRRFFIKIHRGCGWGEILKNLASARPPVMSARNEWEAIEALHQLDIATLTLAGKGLRGRHPAHLESFVVTEALDGMISLEDLVKDWGGLEGPRRIRLKRGLVESMARIARRMHDGGLNHRDFYLCHFLVKNRDWSTWTPEQFPELILIDLHRVQRRPHVPRRWIIKDLAALLCSSFDWGVRRRDILLFVRVYAGKSWKAMTPSEKRFWHHVWKRAWHLFTGFYKRQPPPVP